MVMIYPLSNVSLTDKEKINVDYAFAASWISGTGLFVRQFEEMLADRVQRKHVVAVANGTLALELALKTMGIGPGHKVIVPALTFVAPAAAVLNVGAEPVLVDVSADHWTLDPELLPLHANAIIAVDLMGHPADYQALHVASGLPIIEDAAEAHGACYRGMPVGSFGVISTFSFHANKTITTGEGGAVLTDSDFLADNLRLVANHGMRPERPYFHEVVGSNYRMTNLTAAIGCGQMERWDELVAKRNQVAQWYDERLPKSFGRRPVMPWATEACWLYTVTHPERDRVVASLRECGIDARAIWCALPDLPLYAPYSTQGDYPIARRVAREAFLLPTSAVMSEEDVDTISGVLMHYA